MTKTFIALWGTLCLAVATNVAAENAWILLYKNSHYVVVRATGSKLSDTVYLGNTPSYGQWGNAFAFLSGDSASAGYRLNLLDRASGKITRSLAVTGTPLMQLSGPSPDIALIDDAAFYVTMRMVGAPGVEPNSLGGTFDFIRIELTSGTIKTLPLAADLSNPRVVSFNGSPLIYSWNGYTVYQLDAQKAGFRDLVPAQSMVDLLLREKEGQTDGTVATGAFSDYAFLPAKGAFRLSKLGSIQPVLSRNLDTASESSPSLNLGDARETYMIPATFEQQPVLGIVRKIKGDWLFHYVDPDSLRILATVSLSSDVSPKSVIEAPSVDAVYYVNQDTGTIMKSSKTGAETLWDLRSVGSEGFGYVRILDIEP